MAGAKNAHMAGDRSRPRLNITMDDNLALKLKKLANARGVSFSHLLEQIGRAELERVKKETAT